MYIIYPPVVKHGKSTCFFVRRKSELETSVDRGFSSGIAPHRGGVGVVAALLAVGLGDLAVDHHHVGPEEVLKGATVQRHKNRSSTNIEISQNFRWLINVNHHFSHGYMAPFCFFG
jgi:hypothetical protein